MVHLYHTQNHFYIINNSLSYIKLIMEDRLTNVSFIHEYLHEYVNIPLITGLIS